jgi:hypothetical protein
MGQPVVRLGSAAVDPSHVSEQPNANATSMRRSQTLIKWIALMGLTLRQPI